MLFNVVQCQQNLWVQLLSTKEGAFEGSHPAPHPLALLPEAEVLEYGSFGQEPFFLCSEGLHRHCDISWYQTLDMNMGHWGWIQRAPLQLLWAREGAQRPDPLGISPSATLINAMCLRYTNLIQTRRQISNWNKGLYCSRAVIPVESLELKPLPVQGHSDPSVLFSP